MLKKITISLITFLSAINLLTINLFADNSYSDYFPLQMGNEWHYAWAGSGDAIQTNSLTDSIIINDKSYFIFHDNAWPDYLNLTIDTIRMDDNYKILEYHKGKEQVLFDFTLPNDSSYQYLKYSKDKIDTLTVTVYRHETRSILLTEYENVIQFMFDKPIYDGDEYNYYFAPNIGIISKHFMCWPNHEIHLVSSEIDDQYNTNLIQFFPNMDTITVSAGCSCPQLIVTHENQTDQIDSINITYPYNWFEVHNPPNYYSFEKCGFEIYDLGDQYEYELWYNPIKSSWFNIQHIVSFDTLEEYLGDFEFTLRVIKNDIIIDYLSHFIRAIEYMTIEDEINPCQFNLSQNYPNPFNPTTMISYQLPINSAVKLSVYNMLGQKVVTLVNEKKNAGTHQVVWNASNYSSGVYFYKIEDGDFMEYRKCLLIK